MPEEITRLLLSWRAGDLQAREQLFDAVYEALRGMAASRLAAAGVGGDPAVESVSLNFSKVQFEYKPQKPDGSLDASLHFKYDLKANKEG